MNLVRGPLSQKRVRGWLLNLRQSGGSLLSRIRSIRRFGRKPRLIYGGWEANRWVR
jgi:hypothetical protein